MGGESERWGVQEDKTAGKRGSNCKKERVMGGGRLTRRGLKNITKKIDMVEKD